MQKDSSIGLKIDNRKASYLSVERSISLKIATCESQTQPSSHAPALRPPQDPLTPSVSLVLLLYHTAPPPGHMVAVTMMYRPSSASRSSDAPRSMSTRGPLPEALCGTAGALGACDDTLSLASFESPSTGRLQ